MADTVQYLQENLSIWNRTAEGYAVKKHDIQKPKG